MKDLKKIRRLVGDITAEQLTYVDCAVTDSIGIFMPVAGQCQYAISPEHTHPAWSFIVSFDSRCRTRVGGKIYDSTPSTVFTLSPDVPHQELPSDTVARYIAVMIDLAYLQKQLSAYGLSIDALRSGMTCPINQRLVDALKEFMTDYEEAAPGYGQLLEAGGLKITHLLIRLLFNVSQSNEKIRFRMSVTRAIEFLNEHFGEKITVEDLSHVANLSPSRFSHVFKEETAMSPVEYILHTRLDCAKRMLRGNEKTLSQIALDCGFNSSSYFYQCFTRAFNISPSDYRKSISVAELRNSSVGY
jgi:AraC family transcriptional regulator